MVLGLVVGFLRGFDHTRAGAWCVAGGQASTLPDWPAPDGPAASLPSAGVGAVSLAFEGGWILVGYGGWILVGYSRPQRAVRWWVARVKANLAETSLSAWRGRSWKSPFGPAPLARVRETRSGLLVPACPARARLRQTQGRPQEARAL